MKATSKRGWWRDGRARASAALVIVLVVATACASTPSGPATPVPITDFKMIAGRWGGVILGLSGPRNDEGDWVDVAIGEDGSFNFGVYRTIGAFAGKGKLTLKDGKLTGEGERGSATYTLIDRGGKQYLRAEGRLKSGTQISGDLHRTQ